MHAVISAKYFSQTGWPFTQERFKFVQDMDSFKLTLGETVLTYVCTGPALCTYFVSIYLLCLFMFLSYISAICFSNVHG